MLNAFQILIALLVISLPAHANGKPEINIIFVGNSYIFYNNMPQMLETMINQNKNAPIRVNIESITKGGAHFEDHVKNGHLARTLNNGTKWHYVVLQNQSDWAVYNKYTLDIGYKYGKILADQITKAGAVPVLFVTWPKELGTQHYKPHGYIKSFGHQYKSNNYHYGKLAEQIGAQTVPVNDYWVQTLQNYAAVKLYADGSHPTPAGSYLAALAFYKFFTGEPLTTKSKKIRGADEKTMAILRYIVANPASNGK